MARLLSCLSSDGYDRKRVQKHLSSSFLFSPFYRDWLCHDRHDFLFYNFLRYLIPRFGFVGVYFFIC
jgi:hypothetical protein